MAVPDDDSFVEPTGTVIEMGSTRLFRFEGGAVAEGHAHADESSKSLDPGIANVTAEYVESFWNAE